MADTFDVQRRAEEVPVEEYVALPRRGAHEASTPPTVKASAARRARPWLGRPKAAPQPHPRCRRRCS